MQMPRRTRFRLYRIAVIVGMSAKFFYQIWRMSRKERRANQSFPAQAWEDLYRRQAREFRETALRLEGMLIKLGQFLSARADLLPAPYMEELEQLQDQITPLPYTVIREQLVASYGNELDKLFAAIEEEPLAAASLGQVHLGRLPSGEEVAIKVQRPEIEKIIQTDLAATRIVIWFTERWRRVRERVDLKAVYREVARTTLEELNYRMEAEHLEEFRKNFDGRPRVSVPRVFDTLTRDRVLVMEYVAGAKINDLAYMRRHGLDPSEVARRYVHSFLNQIMVDGFFHADPHPGNVFVQPDGNLVFLDFGMMGRIRQEDRDAIRDFLRAILEEDTRSMLRSLRAMGVLVFPETDLEELLHSLSDLMAPYFGDELKTNLNDDVIQGMLDALQEFVYEQPIQLPYHLTFLGRAAGIVAGVSTAMDPDIQYLDIITPFLIGGRGRGESAAVREAVRGSRERAENQETRGFRGRTRRERMQERQRAAATRTMGKSGRGRGDRKEESGGPSGSGAAWDSLLSREGLQQVFRLLVKLFSPYQNVPRLTIAILERLAEGRMHVHHSRDAHPYVAFHRFLNRFVWLLGFGYFTIQGWLSVERSRWLQAVVAGVVALAFLFASQRNTRATEDGLRRFQQNRR